MARGQSSHKASPILVLANQARVSSFLGGLGDYNCCLYP